MNWEENILGGIGRPKFLIIEDEALGTNMSFEEVLSGEWLYDGTRLQITRINDGNLISGDWCAQLENIKPEDTSSATFRQKISTEESLSGEVIFVSFLIKRTDRLNMEPINFYVRSEDGVQHDIVPIDVGPEWEMISFLFEFKVSVDHTDFTLGWYYVRDSIAHEFRIDDIRVYKVSKYYNMPQPQYWTQNFVKEIKNRNELVDGTYKEYMKGWRYQMLLAYEFLTPLQEEVRQEISEGAAVIVYPHEDSMFYQKMIWDGDFERKYFRDKFLGHEGVIPMIGLELIEKKPSDVIGVGGYAFEEAYAGVIS